MKRRDFFQRIFGGLGLVAAGAAVSAPSRTVLIQESQVAGFQFHGGDAIWESMAVGAPLKLIREPKNSHDPEAVAVFFHDVKLGYVPRGDNSAVAQMLDRGEKLEATISRLRVDDDPWQRVRLSIFLL
jgi:hypothetical protein